MRIAVLVDRFLPVSETFVLRQIVGLLERGHNVDIFARSPADAIDATNVNQDAVRRLGERVHYLRGPRNYFWRALKAVWLIASMGWQHPITFARALNVLQYRRAALSLNLLYSAACLIGAGRQFDIVHCQYGQLGLVALRLKKIGALAGKLVTSFRGNDSTRYLKAHPGAYRELFREGDLFCPVSEFLKHVIIAAGCSEKRTQVLHSGVDCAKLTYSPRERDPDEPTKLLTVSRLEDKKGVAYAIEAVARLARQGKRVSFVIAGDGRLRLSLERLIQDVGLSGGQVRILGWVSEEQVTRLLREAHILVAPSVTAENGDQEGIPNALKEAMATGLPVVSTWHSGIPELVEDGVSGFLVPERDVDALADRLAYLIDHPELWPAMGRAGRMKVEREFDMKRLNDTLVDLYQQLLHNGAPAYTEDHELVTAH